MARYCKKPIEIEAIRWFKFGDHPAVTEQLSAGTCRECQGDLLVHGWIRTKEGGHIVCPGDWVITGIAGEHYPCKPEIFKQTYDLVND